MPVTSLALAAVFAVSSPAEGEARISVDLKDAPTMTKILGDLITAAF